MNENTTFTNMADSSADLTYEKMIAMLDSVKDVRVRPDRVAPFRSLFSMPIIESELCDEKPILQMRPPEDPEFDYVSPEFRREMNAWLRERFGVRPAHGYIMRDFGSIIVPRGFSQRFGGIVT
jgi:hypothetical protein